MFCFFFIYWECKKGDFFIGGEDIVGLDFNGLDVVIRGVFENFGDI